MQEGKKLPNPLGACLDEPFFCKTTEAAVLGCILLDDPEGTQISAIAGQLTPEDFFFTNHKTLYVAILSLYEQHIPIDPVTIQTRLLEEGNLEAVGGMSGIGLLLDGGMRLYNIEAYIERLMEKTSRRRAVMEARGYINAAKDPLLPLDNVISIGRSLGDIHNSNTAGITTFSQVIPSRIEHIEAIANGRLPSLGITTGFPSLDLLTCGLQRKEMSLLGARPAVGKTSFLIQVAEAAAEKGHSVGVVSLEMAKELLGDRLLCSRARVDAQRYRSGQLGKMDWRSLMRASQEILNFRLPILVDDKPSQTAAQIDTLARNWKKHQGLDLLLIDYAGLMRPAPRDARRDLREQLAGISMDLRAIAKDHNLHLMAAIQLNRNLEHRGDSKPRLSDLRDSGCWEQDADIVLFLDGQVGEPTRELIIAKQRNGPTDEIPMTFHGEHTRFEEA